MFTKMIVALFLVHLCTSTAYAYWEGNWFPGDPGAADTNDVVDNNLIQKLHEDNNKGDGKKEKKVDLKDKVHGIKMGISDPDCDDAKKDIHLDWDGSPKDYTCYGHKYKINRDIKPKLVCDHIPSTYVTIHYCMNTTIKYKEDIPTFGNHRPLWAKYGEFTYVPKQRWLHNLEHGSIVMLYHPCANPREVFKLKSILRNCMWKHVISAHNGLSQETPMVLLSWGCRFYLNKVYPKSVINFIKTHAMHGPEEMYNQGFYTKGLLKAATLISDKNDTVICPSM